MTGKTITGGKASRFCANVIRLLDDDALFFELEQYKRERGWYNMNPLRGLMFGASYTSNLAGSDALNEVVAAPDNLESLVAGWSVYATYEFLDRFKLIGEYVAALDNFKAGEIYDAADTRKRKPAA